jgi:hypothetical protein
MGKRCVGEVNLNARHAHAAIISYFNSKGLFYPQKNAKYKPKEIPKRSQEIPRDPRSLLTQA